VTFVYLSSTHRAQYTITAVNWFKLSQSHRVAYIARELHFSRAPLILGAIDVMLRARNQIPRTRKISLICSDIDFQACVWSTEWGA